MPEGLVTPDVTVLAKRRRPRRRGAALAPLLALTAAVVTGATPAGADAYPRQAVDVLHYVVAISFLPDFAYEASTRLDVRVGAEGLSQVTLDLDGPRVDRVTTHEKPLQFRPEGGRLRVDLGRPHEGGEIVPILVEYHGRPDGTGLRAGPNGYGRPTLFADNWPEGARRWIPSIDHPSDKATVDFEVTAPDHYDVVAPGRLVETRSLLDGRRLTRWSEAVPIPTYCMVIGLAEFAVAHLGEADGVPLSAWTFPQDAGTASRTLARAAFVLERFSDLLGPFPYEKLAHVESSTRWGAVEYASAVFYAERHFRGPNAGEGALAHETAHQWWGDSVTPADWDDVWLSEGFATYFDALFYEGLEGPGALRAHMARAAERVRKETIRRAGAVVDPAVTDPAAKLNAFTYQKGALVLHMLRRKLGDDAFFRGLRAFYRLHAGGTATTDDFRRVMEATTGQELSGFLTQWLRRTDAPDLRIAWRWDEVGRQAEVEVVQAQAGEPYEIDLDLAFHVGDAVERRTISLRGRSQSVGHALLARPSALEVDPDGWLLHTAAITKR